jgi:glutamate carboxypeptidase
MERMDDFDLNAMVDAISAWARVESPTSHKHGVNRMMDLVAEELATPQVALERIEGRDGLGGIVVARAGPHVDRLGVLVLSHLDTVHPVGTIEGPLVVRRDEDRLYGPGVYDMKGGAYLALTAFRRVAQRGLAKLPVTYMFTPDEEIGSPTSRALIEEEARRAAYVLVTEPARDGGKVVTSRKGVGRFTVHVGGRASHAGTRHQYGRNAIREAAQQILKVEALTDYSRGITINVGLVSGGTAENVVAQHASFTVDLRVKNAADGERLAATILGLKPIGPDLLVSVEGGMNRPPYEKSPETARLFEHARECAAELGIVLADVPMTGGGSDGNFTAVLGVPTLDGLGIDGDGAHTLHEYALVSSILPRSRLMESLLRTLQ